MKSINAHLVIYICCYHFLDCISPSGCLAGSMPGWSHRLQAPIRRVLLGASLVFSKIQALIWQTHLMGGLLSWKHWCVGCQWIVDPETHAGCFKLTLINQVSLLSTSDKGQGLFGTHWGRHWAPRQSGERPWLKRGSAQSACLQVQVNSADWSVFTEMY